MKIGILVGKTDKGKFEVIGDIGDVAACKTRFNALIDNGGVVSVGKMKKKYVELILSDLNRESLKRRKCR